MVKNLVQQINRLRTPYIHFDLKVYQKILDQINQMSEEIGNLTPEQLKMRASELKERVRNQEDCRVEAFALAREVAWREIGLRPFDCQVICGLALYDSHVVQMNTGEGKTLAAVLPIYLRALEGKGAHILTFNDYLARRDAQWMGPIYRFLGLEVKHIQKGMDKKSRKEAYQADITYLTAQESGFDYLRDHLCTHTDQLVHRKFHFALVDEADSIMIDEARVPLVIAASTEEPDLDPRQAAQWVRELTPEKDVQADPFGRYISFTEEGFDVLEEKSGNGSLFDPENKGNLTVLNLALQAEHLLKRDVDYIVRHDQIELVDEFTGRVALNRRWPYGLQTALEAKEGVTIQPEGRIMGSIPIQHFLNLYPLLSGMTATAEPSAEEIKEFYHLDTVVIPPHRPCIRQDFKSVIFPDREAKTEALIAEITQVHQSGRPILVGTPNVEESESLHENLLDRGINSTILNAKNDAKEAEIVSKAGIKGAVTISTNMAGRGTDICLGEGVAELGGLYVIGTNLHESKRIDDQLRGRAGRQGDPGSSRFFVSLEDDLFRRYGLKDQIPSKYLHSENLTEQQDIILHRELNRAQRIIESQNFEIRKTLWKYSLIIQEQLKIIYTDRENALQQQCNGRFLKGIIKKRDITPKVLDLEQQLYLYHLDQCWTGYQEEMVDIKEGIHLVRMGGRIPSDEYQKRAVEKFELLDEKIKKEVIQTLKKMDLTQKEFSLTDAGLKPPSSTWTYLINDNLTDNRLTNMLIGNNSFAFAAGLTALQFLPLVIIGAIARLFGFGKRKPKR